MRRFVWSVVASLCAGSSLAQNTETSGAFQFLQGIQGTYKTTLELSCDEALKYGEVTSIDGFTFNDLETTCMLKEGQAIGNMETVLFQTQCAEEGDTGDLEILLHSDGGESLAVLKPYSIAVWYPCDVEE